MARRPKIVIPPLQSLVVILWNDAGFDLDEEQKTCMLQTVGWLVKANKQLVVVAGESDIERKYQRSFTTIPRSLILSILDLE